MFRIALHTPTPICATFKNRVCVEQCTGAHITGLTAVQWHCVSFMWAVLVSAVTFHGHVTLSNIHSTKQRIFSESLMCRSLKKRLKSRPRHYWVTERHRQNLWTCNRDGRNMLYSLLPRRLPRCTSTQLCVFQHTCLFRYTLPSLKLLKDRAVDAEWAEWCSSVHSSEQHSCFLSVISVALAWYQAHLEFSSSLHSLNVEIWTRWP